MNYGTAILESLGSVEPRILKPLKLETGLQNQLLFFLKPEAFLASARERILMAALDQVAAFQIDVDGLAILPAAFLSASGVMDRHYGVINQLSRFAGRSLTAEERGALTDDLALPTSTVVLGGHEALQEYRNLDPGKLDHLWATKPSRKLKSGFYYQSYEILDKTVVIVNGFHPAQLQHFTGEGRAIALLLLHSDLPWMTLRSEFLGDTFPGKARPGSLRGMLFARKQELALEDVSVAANFAHLSAGPFEAAFELNNFFGSVSDSGFARNSLSVARRLQEVGSDSSALDEALTNPVLELPGGQRTLFDLTEETDLRSGVAAFRAFSSSRKS